MTKEELWKIYCDKNPQFAEEEGTVTLSAKGLKKLFEQTWDIAQAAKPSRDLFNDMFGGGMAKPKAKPAPPAEPTIPCLTCDGRGTVTKGFFTNPCASCGGHGRITTR